MTPSISMSSINSHDQDSTSSKVTLEPAVSECPAPIAIVGMGCRWPGGVTNTSELWQLLKDKKSGYQEFKSDRLNLDGFYHENRHRPGSMYTRGGFFLDEDPKAFDHTFFGITATETLTLDPAQRKVLEVVYEAFENAGERWEDFSGSRTGVFVGNFNYEHNIMQHRDIDHALPYATTGGGITILSNRINYIFNLNGPSVTLDTACSSSMYALHLAVAAIRAGDCDAAIVAGSNLIMGPDGQIFTTKLGAVSPTSICHTFDESADGYARAEGFGALYIKKVEEAVEKGDPIRAVIRGTSINANGKTGGISHPSAIGQEAVIRQAYKSAGGLDPSLTGYFECHGTGTQVGDPLEVSAIGRVFSSGRQIEPLLIGAVKPNIGHSESSSGIAGVMKAVLALEHGLIPPTIGLVNPNPSIDFSGARVKVVTEMTPWPDMPIRRASVNSFGYGGANAHCILEHPSSVVPGYSLHGRRKTFNEASSKPTKQSGTKALNGHSNGHTNGNTNGKANGHTNGHINGNGTQSHDEIPRSVRWTQQPKMSSRPNAQTRKMVLMPFSAHNAESLKANVVATTGVLDEYKLADLAYTLSSRTSTFVQRAYSIFDTDSPDITLNVENLITGKSSSSKANNIGFIFTGQGAQWPEMGANLFSEYQVFRDTINYLDFILQKLSNRPSWTLRGSLEESTTTSRIQEPEISQAVCTALQIGLVNLLRTWNIKPTMTVGHSSGELAAAYASGTITAAEAIIMAFFRGQVVASNKREGLMLAVGLGQNEVMSYLVNVKPDVRIAAVNSPNSVTLSGEVAAVTEVANRLKKDNHFNRTLKTGGNAYHSHHMAALGETYEVLATQGLLEIAADIASEPRSVSPAKWTSSVYPEKSVLATEVGPSYWRKNLESAVLFSPAVQFMAKSSEIPIDVLIEIGPHPALNGPLKQIRAKLAEENNIKIPICLASLIRGQNDVKSMLNLAGNLFLANSPVNISAANAIDVDKNGNMSLEHGCLCIDKPKYSYNYSPEPIYYENRLNREWRLRKHLRHDLLGARQPGCSKICPSWRNILRLKDVPWLDDHKLLPHAVFPAAGYLAMAIEAISQLHFEKNTDPLQGFELRNVAIESTLQVPEGEVGVEMILNMQATTSQNNGSPKWFTFKISSVQHGTENWTEHCSGTICAVAPSKATHEIISIGGNVKPMDISRWYEKFSEVGLGYGPVFQGLSDLQVNQRLNCVTSNVDLDPRPKDVNPGDSTYAVHPGTLDTCLQLALIASHGGQAETVRTAFVPVVAGNISIWLDDKPDVRMIGTGVAKGEIRGLRGLYARSQLFNTAQEPLMDIKDLRCVSYDGLAVQSGQEKLTRNPYFRLAWKPDINSLTTETAREALPSPVDHDTMEPILENFSRLSAYILAQLHEVQQNLSDERRPVHIEKLLKWTERIAEKAKAGTVKYGGESFSASQSKRLEVITQLSKELVDVPEAKLMKRIHDNLHQLISGETSCFSLLLEENLLFKLFESGITYSGTWPKFLKAIDLLAHKNPRMSILEINAGAATASRLVLDSLQGKSGARRYGNYCFTEANAASVSGAEQQLREYHGISYMTLDIEQDPTSQGFEQKYDVVIATNGLHNTRNIQESIINARALLKPGGKMLLMEMTHDHIGRTLLFGTLETHWLTTMQGHESRPVLNQMQWNQTLRKNGFSGDDIFLDDYPEDLAMSSIILTTAVTASEINSHSTIYVVYCDAQPALATSIEDELKKSGHKVVLTSVGTTLPPLSRVISLIEIEQHLFPNADPVTFEAVKALTSQASSLMWVSKGNPITPFKPESAIMIGLLRSISTEMPQSKIASLCLDADFEKSETDTARMIVIKEQELQERKAGEEYDGEYAMHNGLLNVSRLVPDKVFNEDFRIRQGLESPTAVLPMDSHGPLQIDYAQPGIISSLFFKQDCEFAENLQEGCVEIETKAIGLNVKDLAVATGKFDWNRFSTECSGVVVKTHPSVTTLKVGDRVFGAVPGNMGNFVRSPASLVQKMGPNDRFADLASVPVAFMTSVYALKHLARLEPGESVLIQSATGGLGIAALQVAKHLGAEIYATVGNASKVKVLVEQFGIAEDHIFSSRNVNDFSKIVKATGGKGIDVILCSAAGEMMHETWRCIAPLGRFIEVGRTEILSDGKLGLEVFKRNASFSSFDLGLLNRQKPQVVAKLLAEVAHMLQKGYITPINFIKTFDVSQIEEAMIYFSKGTHTGKVVVTYENPKALLKIEQPVPRVAFDQSATYLLIGCLGGLGRSIGTWMVSHGAKHLTFASRSGLKSPAAATMAEELYALGVKVDIVKCDVTVRDEVDAVVKQISEKRTIKGVLHAAMVEGDCTFENTTLQQMESVLAPKVLGTVNIHEATLSLPLDFFIMTSSIVTMLGNASQGAYSAANAFQDSFARYRVSKGLPAHAIALGMILEIGFVSKLPAVQKALARNGVYGTSEYEFLQLFEASFRSQAVQSEWSSDPFAVAHLLVGLEPARLIQLGKSTKDFTWHTDARFNGLQKVIEDQSQPQAGRSIDLSVLDRLKRELPENRLQLVTEAIVERLAKLLSIAQDEIDTSQEVSRYGMDSMLAAELRNWLFKTFGAKLSALELLSSATSIAGLSKVISDRSMAYLNS